MIYRPDCDHSIGGFLVTIILKFHLVGIFSLIATAFNGEVTAVDMSAMDHDY